MISARIEVEGGWRLMMAVIVSVLVAGCAHGNIVADTTSLSGFAKDASSSVYRASVHFQRVSEVRIDDGRSLYLAYFNLDVVNTSPNPLVFRETGVRFQTASGIRVPALLATPYSGQFVTFRLDPGKSVVVEMYLDLESYEASTLRDLVNRPGNRGGCLV